MKSVQFNLLTSGNVLWHHHFLWLRFLAFDLTNYIRPHRQKLYQLTFLISTQRSIYNCNSGWVALAFHTPLLPCLLHVHHYTEEQKMAIQFFILCLAWP